jgi:hypothetical protein
MYGPHRPYGYLYGGSGGGYKTMGCMENTSAWDGAVPYVIGSPMAIPNCFTVRAHAKRLLRGKLHLVADAMEPGGSDDPYANLNEEQRSALEEVTRMGFPLKSWYQHETLDDGALPLLVGYFYAMDATYFTDFWSVPGYLGADEKGSAVRDRVHYKSRVAEVHLPHQGVSSNLEQDMSGVDDSWKRQHTNIAEHPVVILDSTPTGDLYMGGMQLIIQSGNAVNYRVPVKSISNNRIIIGEGFGLHDMLEKLALIKPGDEVLIDNSDYIAMQTYHRHQLPDESYEGWKQFRNDDGTPKYPQRSVLIGPVGAQNAAGSVQSGRINGKMIVIAALMDESAFPWQADWYRKKVEEQLGNEAGNSFRLWYVENALHGDTEKDSDKLHIIGYLNMLYKALIDISKWVENGDIPADSTLYSVTGGQVSIPDNVTLRTGIQPVIKLKANDSTKAVVQSGYTVRFTADIQVPDKAGRLLSAEWVFNDAKGPQAESIVQLDGQEVIINAEHSYNTPGTYYAVLRIYASREGNENDIFSRVGNLARVRIVVE